MAVFVALFKSLPCFQCSWDLQGIFLDDWSRDCRIYKKNLSSGFWKCAKFLGTNQIMSKSCIKSSWMQVNKILLTRDRPEQFPSFLYAVFNGIKPLWDEAAFSKLIIFLKYQRIVWLACYFTVFMILKIAIQNISKTLS